MNIEKYAKAITEQCHKVRDLIDKYPTCAPGGRTGIPINGQIEFLNKDYVEALKKLEKPQFLIIGQDPFPKLATGIPFLKENKHKKTYVVPTYQKHINRIEKIENLTESSKLDRGAMVDLAKQGIVFLNASYFFRESIVGVRRMAKNKPEEDQVNAIIHNLEVACYNFNKVFIQNVMPSKIYCLGQKAEHVVARALCNCFEHPASPGETLYKAGLKEM